MKKIVAIGPESTGKSTLCEQLALHFDTLWVPEFARTYLTENGRDYSFDDLLTIARGQLELEEKYISRCTQPLLFVDTDMYVMKVWCEFVFGKCHQWILDRIAEREYDLYLLCNTDLSWTPDTLREYPDPETRRTLFHMYRDLLINQQTPWFEVRGAEESRWSSALSRVNELL